VDFLFVAQPTGVCEVFNQDLEKQNIDFAEITKEAPKYVGWKKLDNELYKSKSNHITASDIKQPLINPRVRYSC